MTQYIQFEIINQQPLKIADLAASKPGEMETLTYLPGTTIRGAVLQALSNVLGETSGKRKLLSEKVRFLNAYPMRWINGKVKYLMPSPKGFYENKKQTGELENVVVSGVFTEGNKRASLGRYCYIDEDGKTICYTSVEKQDVLGIHVKEKNIFRQNVLAEGQHFAAAIAVEEDAVDLIKPLCDRLEKESFYVGSGRGAGFGKCQIKNVIKTKEISFYGTHKLEAAKQVYLYAISNLTMRNEWGEVCGLNTEKLASCLGVDSLEVERCATSVIRRSGINRTWGCRTQENLFYEAGSVFLLKSEELISADAMERLEQSGIGINRAEGCGRVLFLPEYAKWCRKKAIEEASDLEKTADLLKQDDVDKNLKIAAKAILKIRIETKMNEKLSQDKEDPLKEIGKSQLGLLSNICRNCEYTPEQAISEIKKYVGHENEKLSAQARQSSVNAGKTKMIKYLGKLQEQDIWSTLQMEKTTICGFDAKTILTPEEDLIYRLQYTERWIQMKNRGGSHS